MRAFPTIVYVAGSGRSGSTLLDRLLGQVPGFVSTGELARLWDNGLRDNRRCGCGVPFRDCAFWTQVGRQAYGGWSRVDVDRALYLQRTVRRHRYLPLNHLPGAEAYRCRREELCQLLDPLYRAVAAVSGCPVVVDSSKELVYASVLRHAFGDCLRVVHLVRDARGVAHSWTRAVDAQSGGPGPLELDRYSPVRSALRWSGYNVALELLGMFGTRLRRLRYEDLIAAPAEQVRSIMAFAGLDPAGTGLAFLTGGQAIIGVNHTVAGNPMRFAQGQIALRRDDAWRQSMRAGQRRVVTLLAAPALVHYGYLRRPRPGWSG